MWPIGQLPQPKLPPSEGLMFIASRHAGVDALLGHAPKHRASRTARRAEHRLPRPPVAPRILHAAAHRGKPSQLAEKLSEIVA